MGRVLGSWKLAIRDITATEGAKCGRDNNEESSEMTRAKQPMPSIDEEPEYHSTTPIQISILVVLLVFGFLAGAAYFRIKARVSLAFNQILSQI